MPTSSIPTRQHAIELTGPGTLTHRHDKPVIPPGPHEVLLRIEAVGLCFSDLKLLDQFDGHARKSAILEGIDPAALESMHSYVPGKRPGVPGHEAVGRIVAVGDAVKHHRVGERCLVQTDYRRLKTAHSNAAFGYNFEGGLQEYVLLDERVIIDEHGQRFLIPVQEQHSASAVALVEPWACVENSYRHPERRWLKPGGQTLVVQPADQSPYDPAPCQRQGDVPVILSRCQPQEVAACPDTSFDDIVYIGDSAETIEVLNDKLANGGILNVVLAGGRLDRLVSVGVGRIHYGMTRWIGTPGEDPAHSYQRMPHSNEVRAGDHALVIGATGPMGQMHTLRLLASGIADIKVTGIGSHPQRLRLIDEKASRLAQRTGIPVQILDRRVDQLHEAYDYFAIMAPVASLVNQCIAKAAPQAIVNLFAGIPAPVKEPLDLDAYIRKGLFMFGTSGSEIEDMLVVLDRMDRGQLDTNLCVEAISGMAGAAAGLDAVRERLVAGKIIVYPSLHDMELTPLDQLQKQRADIAAHCEVGLWGRAAEDVLVGKTKPAGYGDAVD